MARNSAIGFTSDEDYIFGIDFSKLDVSEILDETDTSATSTSYECDEERSEIISKYSILVDRLLVLNNLNCPSRYTPNYEVLFRSATTLGAYIEKIACRPDEFGGMCLVSVIPDKQTPGDVIAVLPRSLRIGQTTACQRLGLPKGTPDLSALSLFLVDLIANSIPISNTKHNNDSSNISNKDIFLSHYVKCLPKSGGPNALFMKEEEIQYWTNLGGMEYRNAISGVKNQAKSCIEYIQDCLTSSSYISKEPSSFESDDICWAISIVQSRTHGFGQARSRWLTPIFDFANHSPNPNCKLEGDSQGQLVLRAIRTIFPGEEITIDYMVSNDAKLVATYGFSLKHAPHF